MFVPGRGKGLGMGVPGILHNMRPEESLAKMIDSLPDKTGKSLDEWKQIIAKEGLTKHTDIVKFLKEKHGLTHGFANQIALRSKPEQDEGDPIEAMFAKKEKVRPIFDTLLARIKDFGPDVDLAPKKGYVSARRKKQFAILQPTATRLDVGINLKGVDPHGRLEASGSFNAMLSHRVKVNSVDEVDADLVSWVWHAYEEA